MTTTDTTTPTADEVLQAVTTRLAAIVGTTSTVGGEFLSSCAEEAIELVDTYAGTAVVPAVVMIRAYLEVAADLWHRRTARNGVAGFEDAEISPSPVRINRDPMTPAYPLLRPYVTPGIA